MIRRHLMALRVALMLGDGLSAMLVFLGVSIVRFRDGDPAELWRDLGIDIRLATVIFAVTWVIVLWSMGLYRLDARWRLFTEARDIAKTSLIVLALTLSTLFLVKQQDVSRLFIAFLFVAQPTVTLAGRAILRLAFAAIRTRGYDTRYMIVAGTGRLAQDFAERVENHPGLGMKIIGHLSAPEAAGRPVLVYRAGSEPTTADEELRMLDLPVAETAAGLADAIERLSDTEGREEYFATRRASIEASTGPLDGASAARIVALLRSLSESFGR